MIVLRGRAEAFSSGDDLSATNGGSLEEFLSVIETILKVALAIVDAPQIVVASLDGAIIGGGVEIGSAFDLPLGTKSVRIGCPDAYAGMSVTGETSVLLTRIIGEGSARNILFLTVA